MNIDSINNEEGRHYVQTWIKALEVLLNWSQEQTLEWAQKWQTGLNDRQPGFFNDTPGRYLLPLLIPPNIKEGLSGNEAAHLKDTILCIMENQDSFCYRKSDFDWRLVKTKIAVFFGKLEEEHQRLFTGLSKAAFAEKAHEATSGAFAQNAYSEEISIDLGLWCDADCYSS
jgi:hypothetical protein